jgi:hypothetical protein
MYITYSQIWRLECGCLWGLLFLSTTKVSYFWLMYAIDLLYHLSLLYWLQHLNRNCQRSKFHWVETGDSYSLCSLSLLLSIVQYSPSFCWHEFIRLHRISDAPMRWSLSISFQVIFQTHCHPCSVFKGSLIWVEWWFRPKSVMQFLRVLLFLLYKGKCQCLWVGPRLCGLHTLFILFLDT